MKIYNALVYYYNRRIPNILYESPPIEIIYKPQSGTDHGRQLVTLGIRFSPVESTQLRRKETVLGFIGVIRTQQGLDIVLQYLQSAKKARLEIVGNGYWLDHYKQMAVSLGISDKVKFFGFVENKGRVIANWDIGIALYENTINNISKYCEPTKIKDYLEFGLPVITTKTTYFYEELEKYNAGVAVDESTESIRRAVEEIISHKKRYQDGVKRLVKKYEYIAWYQKRFRFLEKA